MLHTIHGFLAVLLFSSCGMVQNSGSQLVSEATYQKYETGARGDRGVIFHVYLSAAFEAEQVEELRVNGEPVEFVVQSTAEGTVIEGNVFYNVSSPATEETAPPTERSPSLFLADSFNGELVLKDSTLTVRRFKEVAQEHLN